MRPFLLTLLLVAAACAPEPSEVTPQPETPDATLRSDAPPPGEQQIVITTQNGEVDLGLTDEALFFRLSPKRLAEAEREMAADVAEAEGIGGLIAETVTDAVSGALRQRVEVPVEDVREVRYDGGRLDIRLVGDDPFPRIESDSVPFEEGFAPDDAQQFVEAFERVRDEP